MLTIEEVEIVTEIIEPGFTLTDLIRLGSEIAQPAPETVLGRGGRGVRANLGPSTYLSLGSRTNADVSVDWH